jgi:hypothetical protein
VVLRRKISAIVVLGSVRKQTRVYGYPKITPIVSSTKDPVFLFSSEQQQQKKANKMELSRCLHLRQRTSQLIKSLVGPVH